MSIDINKQYKTRDGREVKIFMTDGGGIAPVLGAIYDARVIFGSQAWIAARWYESGEMTKAGPSDDDLIEVES
jgi:hypothetical protein